jgi:hypothetical protein
MLPAFRESLRESVELFPVVLGSEPEVMQVNAPGPGGIGCGIAHSLLIVGASMLNGDPVAIDLRDPAGKGGYLNHETMWGAADLRDGFRPVADSWERLAALIDQCKLPSTYYDAREEGPHGP